MSSYTITKSKFRKIISSIVVFAFFFSLLTPVKISSAQILPVPLSSAFQPCLIKGLTLHPENPLLFDFIVHPGDEHLEGDIFKNEANKLIKYFMASLTVPENQMWVNLSPYEKDRIIPTGFGQTIMGRDLLAQDYVLKQLTASLMSPEHKLGNEFWQRVRMKVQKKYGTTDIPMNTFNKIWILPEKAEIYVNGKSVFIVNSTLKVMLEEDYIALEANKKSTEHGLGSVKEDELKTLTGINAEVVREIIIPEIEHEVNEGKTFSNLRQIYNALILATWFKKNLRTSLLGEVYVDRDKTTGVDHRDPAMQERIYNQYLEAFTKGAFDIVKDEYDPMTQSTISRKYFSGGVDYAQLSTRVAEVPVTNDLAKGLLESLTVRTSLKKAAPFAVIQNGKDSLMVRGLNGLPEDEQWIYLGEVTLRNGEARHVYAKERLHQSKRTHEQTFRLSLFFAKRKGSEHALPVFDDVPDHRNEIIMRKGNGEEEWTNPIWYPVGEKTGGPYAGAGVSKLLFKYLLEIKQTKDYILGGTTANYTLLKQRIAADMAQSIRTYGAEAQWKSIDVLQSEQAFFDKARTVYITILSSDRRSSCKLEVEALKAGDYEIGRVREQEGNFILQKGMKLHISFPEGVVSLNGETIGDVKELKNVMQWSSQSVEQLRDVAMVGNDESEETIRTWMEYYGFNNLTERPQREVLVEGYGVVNVAIVGRMDHNILSILREGGKRSDVNIFYVDRASIDTQRVKGKEIVYGKPKFIFRNGKPIFVMSRKKIPLHYVIDRSTFKFTEDFIRDTGIPLPAFSSEIPYLDEKDLTALVLDQESGVNRINQPSWKALIVAKSKDRFVNRLRVRKRHISFLSPKDKDLKTKVVRQMRTFLANNHIHEAIMKPTNGVGGEGVYFFNAINLLEQANQLVEKLKEKENYILQARINPPVLHDVDETGQNRSLDYNLRVFVSPDKKPTMIVRIGEKGKAINLSIDAHPWLFEKLASKLGLDENEARNLKQVVEQESLKAYEAINKRAVRDGFIKQGENATDFMGADVIPYRERREFKAKIIELNGYGSGGLLALDKALQEQGEAYLSPEEVNARIGEGARGWLETAIQRARAYKATLPDGAMLSSTEMVLGAGRKISFNISRRIFNGRHSEQFEGFMRSFININAGKKSDWESMVDFRKNVKDIFALEPTDVSNSDIDQFVDELLDVLSLDGKEVRLRRATRKELSYNFVRIANYLKEEAFKNGYIFVPVMAKRTRKGTFYLESVPRMVGSITHITHGRTKSVDESEPTELFSLTMHPYVASSLRAQFIGLSFIKNATITVVASKIEGDIEESRLTQNQIAMLNEAHKGDQLSDYHEMGHMILRRSAEEQGLGLVRRTNRMLGMYAVDGKNGIERFETFLDLVRKRFALTQSYPRGLKEFLSGQLGEENIQNMLWESAAFSFSLDLALRNGDDLKEVMRRLLTDIQESIPDNWENHTARFFWLYSLLMQAKSMADQDFKGELQFWAYSVLSIDPKDLRIEGLMGEFERMNEKAKIDLSDVNRSVFKQMTGNEIDDYVVMSSPQQSPRALKNYVDQTQDWEMELADAAMEAVESDVGGIDLNPQNIQMDVQGKMIDLKMPPISPEEYQNIEGFRPVIINVTPVTNIPLLLGGIAKVSSDDKYLSKL
jgi:hypothetical protein